MKKYLIISMIAAAGIFASCGPEPVGFDVNTGSESGSIAMGPEGGVTSVSVTAPGDWVVVTEEPWISVSPANGRGSAAVSYTHLTLPTNVNV